MINDENMDINNTQDGADEIPAEGAVTARIIPVELQNEMKKSFLEYSMSVIISRALPDVRDGLKPVHRRVLYAMDKTNLTADKPYSKSVATVGEVMKYYHPHGDAAIYDTLVRMAQDFSLRYPLIDGHGNFGSIDGDPPAAMRYTEARMSKLSGWMMEDIDKETVDYSPNFDDTTVEPQVLPCRFPNLLVNGSVGIAVGMATNIPPHNLVEVVDAMKYLIDNPDADMNEIMQFVKGPDFPTGGTIMGRAGIREAYATGRGKITLRGKADIVEGKNGKTQIIITEIPYMVNKSRLVASIAELHKEKRVEGITGLVDASDRHGMKIIIDLRKDASPEIVLNRLYSYSQLQDTVGVIMLALVGGEPKVLTLKQMLQHYIFFQEEIVVRRTQFDLRKANERMHILAALLVALDFIDEVIAILRSSKTIPEGKERLMERFEFDEVQADAIVAMRLGQLTGLERGRLEDETAALKIKIDDLNDILANRSRVMDIIKTEVGAISDRFGDVRRTDIADVSGEVDIEELIPVHDCVVTLTGFGYVKRLPADTYRSQKRGGRGISGMTRREEDAADEMFVVSSHDALMFITDRGRVFKIKCYEIPETGRSSKGNNIINLLALAEGEKVTKMLRVPAYEEGMNIVFVTEKGIMKRTALSEFAKVRRSGLIALSIDEGDALVSADISGGNDDFIVASRCGMAVRFKETDVRVMGRTARGVRVMRLAEGDAIVGMEKVREGKLLLTVTESGYGRRSDPDEYRLIKRGGKGVTNYKQTDKRGLVTGIKMVDETEDVVMITDEGIILRTPAKDISIQSRSAGGVTVMRVAAGSRVTTLSTAPGEDENADAEEVTEVETESPVAPAEEPESGGQKEEN